MQINYLNDLLVDLEQDECFAVNGGGDDVEIAPTGVGVGVGVAIVGVGAIVGVAIIAGNEKPSPGGVPGGSGIPADAFQPPAPQAPGC